MKNRDMAAQIFFETFNVPALQISIQAVLALYASGRTTGLVLDSGDGVTHTVPVFEGYAAHHAIRRIDLAGRDVTDYLKTLLRKSGYGFYTSGEWEVVRQIKEKMCYLATTAVRDEKDCMGLKSEEYVLPDGQKISVRNKKINLPYSYRCM